MCLQDVWRPFWNFSFVTVGKCCHSSRHGWSSRGHTLERKGRQVLSVTTWGMYKQRETDGERLALKSFSTDVYQKPIKTQKLWFKQTLIYFDTNTQYANFRGNHLCQATTDKWLKTMKNERERENLPCFGWLTHTHWRQMQSFFCYGERQAGGIYGELHAGTIYGELKPGESLRRTSGWRDLWRTVAWRDLKWRTEAWRDLWRTAGWRDVRRAKGWTQWEICRVLYICLQRAAWVLVWTCR